MEKVIIDNKAVSKADTTVKVGLNQVTKPTPQLATNIFRIVLYAAFVVNIVLATFADIPNEIKDIAGRYSIEIVTLVHALTKLFGLNVEEPK